MYILTFCDSPDVLNVVRIVKIIINIIRIAVPVLLILILSINYMNAIKVGDEDLLAKVNKTLVSRLVAAAMIFLVPVMVNAITKAVSPESEYRKCMDFSTSEHIQVVYNSNAEDAVSRAESSLEMTDYNAALLLARQLDDEDLRNSLLSRLDSTKAQIDAKRKQEQEKNKGSANNNSSGNNNSKVLTNTIFLGDSRTVGMESKTNASTEITIAKSGGTYYDFLNHSEQAKQYLGKGTAYNIVLNYGVNDLYNISKYCDGYMDFINSVGKDNKIYIESVNPLGDDRNSKVTEFNSTLKSCVSGSNVYYCDVNNKATISTWKNGYLASDNIHYTSSGYQFIYNNIKGCINGSL